MRLGIIGGETAADAALSHGEWPAYAGTNTAARYSPLTQMHAPGGQWQDSAPTAGWT